MSRFFAASFSDLNSAQDGQRMIQELSKGGIISLASSVVITSGSDGEVKRHDGHTPGGLGAGIGTVLGAIIGLIGGPALAAMGAVGGAMSGGWFDLLRIEERQAFAGEVSRNLSGSNAILLAEVASSCSASAQNTVEERIADHGGTMIGK